MIVATVLQRMNAVQQGQRGYLMPWSAVALGCGVGIYFSLPAEPGVLGYALALTVMMLSLAVSIWRREVLGPLGLGIGLIAFGICVAGARAHYVAGPVIDFRYYGAIEGRIVGMDRSSSDALRLTLEDVQLDDVRNTPLRVRVSLIGDTDYIEYVPGAVIMTTGHLSPPAARQSPRASISNATLGFSRLAVLATPVHRYCCWRPRQKARRRCFPCASACQMRYRRRSRANQARLQRLF